MEGGGIGRIGRKEEMLGTQVELHDEEFAAGKSRQYICKQTGCTVS